MNLFFHLTQKPGEWVEKDDVYVVTINLTDGAVEDVYYGLMATVNQFGALCMQRSFML